ncbi:uncharacterized protein LOC114939088 [Nylanderia fulva]|uniref:uncharacterized protein LOC114939088 n=1 Tax=Nylanderia fulva TaxID=613905 RepID=UPI0010FB79FB|nr:uncharacterized protein LOC114939088 [Nylanderia fulva]
MTAGRLLSDAVSVIYDEMARALLVDIIRARLITRNRITRILFIFHSTDFYGEKNPEIENFQVQNFGTMSMSVCLQSKENSTLLQILSIIEGAKFSLNIEIRRIHTLVEESDLGYGALRARLWFSRARIVSKTNSRERAQDHHLTRELLSNSTPIDEFSDSVPQEKETAVTRNEGNDAGSDSSDEDATTRSPPQLEKGTRRTARPAVQESTGLVTVASYRRRHHVAEEVPGLYIRRLTLEDPRRREPYGSRSQSPARHICHPRSGYARSARGSSSYRSWLEKIRKESPAFLTIVSLELPESPIPLIESQANARWRRNDLDEVANDKDDILDEFLKKVTEAGKNREKESRAGKNNVFRKSRRDNKKDGGSLECTKTLATLEECTKNIIEGPSRQEAGEDCICSEVPQDLGRSAELASGDPEVTHTIRIAMKCRHGTEEEEKEEEEAGRTRNDKKDLQGPSNARKDSVKHDASSSSSSRCTVTAGAALDFTLNCNSVRLTSRDTSLKAATPEKGREAKNGRKRSGVSPLESGFRDAGRFCISFK